MAKPDYLHSNRGRFPVCPDAARFPPKQIRVSEFKECLDTRYMTDDQKKILFSRMKQGAPGMYRMISQDPFVRMLAENFNASLLIPKRKRNND
jgi:hypothetical protein